MADQQAFFDLLDIMENEELVEPTRFFDLMCSTFSIANLLYLDVGILTAGVVIHRLHHTFSARSLSTYIDKQYQRIDPILRMTMGGLRPVDWATARKLHPESEPLFSSATQLGHGLDGVTLPLATPPRRLAFLAIQADVPADEWPAYRRPAPARFPTAGQSFPRSPAGKRRGVSTGRRMRQGVNPPGNRSARLGCRRQELLGNRHHPWHFGAHRPLLHDQCPPKTERRLQQPGRRPGRPARSHPHLLTSSARVRR